MATNFVIEISGKNGSFRTENKLTIFQQHVTENRLKDELQAIKKCIKQMNKSGEITIDIAESVNYSYNYQFRLIIGKFSNAFQVDFRKKTEIGDFSDSTFYNFTSERSMYTWIMKFVEQQIRTTVGEIPVERSLFSQSLDTIEA